MIMLVGRFGGNFGWNGILFIVVVAVLATIGEIQQDKKNKK